MIVATPLWGVIEFVILVTLCIAGVPVAVSMGTIGFGFMALYLGLPRSATLVGLNGWTQATNYAFTPFPLFILMGALVAEANLGRDIFDCFNKWLSKLKGGLAIVATMSCAAFGAVTGSSVATTVAIGTVSVPEMKRYGYSATLRTGSIANAGILANLIPPSSAAILYCIVTENSVARVFMAGLIPGIILAILYSVTIYTWVRLNPSSAPSQAGVTYTLKEKLRASKGAIPIIILFVAIIGGIYTGLMSPTEAAGMGVIFAIVLTLVMRRLKWKGFLGSVHSAVVYSAFLMIVIFGAMLLLYSLSVTRLPTVIGETVLDWGMSPTAFLLVVSVIFIIFGCVMESITLIMLFVPMFYPAVMAMGYDPVWYGTFSVVLVELALVTPPIANLIYVTQAVDGEATSMDVIKGVLPFYASALILVLLLMAFPQLALWLPSTM